MRKKQGNAQGLTLIEIKLVTCKATDGRSEGDFFYLPFVGIVEGVLNSELLLSSEFDKDWDGVPVTVNHPSINGQPVSARERAVANSLIGRIIESRVEDQRLKGEVQINLIKARLAHSSATTKLLNGEVTELSTGYFRTLEQVRGTYKGRPYVGIARGIIPDHLAILTDEQGACSVQDGCGVPRTNSNEGVNVADTKHDEQLTNNEQQAACSCQTSNDEQLTSNEQVTANHPSATGELLLQLNTLDVNQLQELLGSLPDIKRYLQLNRQAEEEKRTDLEGRLVKAGFTTEELTGLSINMMQKIAGSQLRTASYEGRAVINHQVDETQETPHERPALFGKKES